jgi:hypothetical protein
MKLVQVFKSADTDQNVGTIEISPMTMSVPVPVPGDYVSWSKDSKSYGGVVKSRSILYSAPESSLAREDAFDLTVTLTVDVTKE